MSGLTRTIFGTLASVLLLCNTEYAFANSTKEARVKLIIDGANMDFWTDNSSRFEALLKKLHPSFSVHPDHRTWMDEILPDTTGGTPATPPHNNFKGLGGIPGYQAWDLADETIGGSKNYDNRIAGELIFGRIEDFTYNPANGSGSMKVIQVYTAGLGRNGRGVGLLKKNRVAAYRFTIDVKPNGFSFDQKDLSDPNNVFPNAFLATGIKISAAKASKFNSKLYAKGDKIEVTNVEKAKKYNQTGDPDSVDWTAQLNKKEKTAVAAIKAIDSTSCIDMMFKDPTPPSSLPDGARPPFYCLGRCGSPMLINTM